MGKHVRVSTGILCLEIKIAVYNRCDPGMFFLVVTGAAQSLRTLRLRDLN